MTVFFATNSPFWQLVSRLGEAQILLPMALGLALLLWRRSHSPRLALIWLAWIAGVAMITTVSKLAFLGWGVGSARLDFTGFSGHAMFAAAIYPVLFGTLALGSTRKRRRWMALGVAVGVGVAALIAVSRIVVDAHSVSEAVSGCLLGLLASAYSLRIAAGGHAGVPVMPKWTPAVMATWLLVLPLSAPASTTHDLVTRLALTLSGRTAPYQRSDLLRRLEQPAAAAAKASLTAGLRTPVRHNGT